MEAHRLFLMPSIALDASYCPARVELRETLVRCRAVSFESGGGGPAGDGAGADAPMLPTFAGGGGQHTGRRLLCA